MQTTEGLSLIQGLASKSRREGRDLLEVMETDGFLLTPTRRLQIAVETLNGLLYILDREQAENLLQRYLGARPSTPQDMYDAVLEWLGDYRDGVKAGHVG